MVFRCHDLRSEGSGFISRLVDCYITTVGKLFTTHTWLYQVLYNLVWAMAMTVQLGSNRGLGGK